MKRLPLLTASLLLLFAAPAVAQSDGGQYRYSNPGQTRQAPQASAPAPTAGEGAGGVDMAGPANPYEAVLQRRQERAEALEAGEDPGGSSFVNQNVGFGTDMRFGYVAAEDVYRGIIPGIQDSLPHISRYQARAEAGTATNILTWIGFQPFDDATRVFIQTGRAARYAVNASPDGLTLTVRIQDARISLYNFRREMDSSWFGRSINSIQAFRNGSYVDVVIELNEALQYNASQDGDYIFLDFQR